LQKRLRSALKDVDKKESYVLDLEQRLSTLEEEVLVLKRKFEKLPLGSIINLQESKIHLT